MNTSRPDAYAAQALADLAEPHPDLQAIVVVPARDEAPRIAACLQALSTQRDMTPGSYEVILILDGCRDRTLQVVQRTASLRRQPAVHTVTLLRPQGVGRARRLGMDIACRRFMQIGRKQGLIASTDADTTVAADCLWAQLALAQAGAADRRTDRARSCRAPSARPTRHHRARTEHRPTAHRRHRADRR